MLKTFAQNCLINAAISKVELTYKIISFRVWIYFSAINCLKVFFAELGFERTKIWWEQICKNREMNITYINVCSEVAFIDSATINGVP